MSKLEDLLRDEAEKQIANASKFIGCSVNYVEHCNEDALNEDAWLNNGTSYIWKVGLLGVVDGNKADWCTLYIGHHRSESAEPELIGKLNWRDGENDDVGRCLHRYVDLLNSDYRFHAVFQDDDYTPPPPPTGVVGKLIENGLLDGAAVRKSLGKSSSLDGITPEQILTLISD